MNSKYGQIWFREKRERERERERERILNPKGDTYFSHVSLNLGNLNGPRNPS
jgi:hypothetical protein